MTLVSLNMGLMCPIPAITTWFLPSIREWFTLLALRIETDKAIQ